MVIRCRFDAEELQENSKPSSQSKTISTCPEGYVSTGDGGCVPNCNYYGGSSYNYVYNSETGLCECDGFIPKSTGSTSKVEEVCTDFCFVPPSETPSLKGNAPSKVAESGPVCNPCENDQLYLNGVCLEPGDCFDGQVDIIPVVDCNNIVDGNVPVTLTISGLGSTTIPEGAFVSLTDIINCLAIDENFNEYLTLAAMSINESTSENGMFAFGPADENGIIEISFYANQGEQIQLELDNGQFFEIETCASDPCSCENPDNIRENGVVVRFADVLTITNLPEGVEVELSINNNPQGFTDEDGNPYTNETLGTAVGGEMEFEFYRGSAEAVNITYTFPSAIGSTTMITRTFVSSDTCDVVDCAIIPTLSQWGLLILGLITSCLALVFMLIRRSAIS